MTHIGWDDYGDRYTGYDRIWDERREEAPPICEKCYKRLSRKTARLIDGKLLCSACLFRKLRGGVPSERSGT